MRFQKPGGVETSRNAGPELGGRLFTRAVSLLHAAATGYSMTPPPIVITPFNSRQMQLPQSPDSPCAERPPRLSRASTGTPSPLASPSFPYPLSPVSPALSDVTVVDMFSPALDHQCRDEDDLAKCSAKDSVQRGGYVKLSLEDLDPNEKLRQMDARMQQRTAHPRTALLALAICLTFAIGFGLGQGSAAEIRTE